MTKINLQTPLALHEAAIAKYRTEDKDAELDTLHTAMREARNDIERLTAFAEALTSDQTHTPAANALRLRKQALKAGERAGGRLDQARARAEAAIQQIRKATACPPPKDQSAAQLEGEIRARLAAMTLEDRGRVIATAISTDDDVLVGAILRGQPWLSGMSETEQDYRRELWRRRRFPHEVDRETRLQKAIDATDRAGRSLIGMVEAMVKNPVAIQAEQNAEKTKALAAE